MSAAAMLLAATAANVTAPQRASLRHSICSSGSTAKVLVNNAGVGLQAPASTGTYKDWEWGLGVNLWGPIYGTRTYVPRMLASKQGAQITTTTSTSGILPGSGAGIYTVAEIAAVGLMEELRLELRN
jgi:NAD(P)-dependent dehydrogenase (short-subunit alcohol dehydrogenase family)